MKIRVLFLTVLLSLALCLPAMAEKKDFGKFKETLNNLQFQRLLFFGKSVFQKLVQM